MWHPQEARAVAATRSFPGVIVENEPMKKTCERDVYKRQPLVCMQHGFADCRCYFFFVESDDAPVALEYCLYHNLLCLNVTVFFSVIAETKIL